MKLISHRYIFILLQSAAPHIHRGSNSPPPQGLISNPSGGMKDVFLMERVYGACWLPHMHNSFSPSLPLRRLLRPLLPRKPPATLSCCSFSPGFRKVTAGCFSSCGLWPVWLSLNTPHHPPLRIAQQALSQTQTRQSQGCRLASLLSTSLAATASLV